MRIQELFSELNRHGIRLEVVDNNLKINAPKGKLTPALVKQLREKKQEIITFLQSHARDREKYSLVEAVEKKEYYPLSSAQKRIYIIQRMDLDVIAYNMPLFLELSGEFDRDKFTAAFRRLIAWHESLRTSFHMLEDEPVQKINEEVEFKVEEEEQTTEDRRQTTERVQTTEDRPQTTEFKQAAHLSSVIHHLSSEFVRPFDLTRAPLLRVGLIEIGKQGHILMVDTHHIVADGVSRGVFIKDFISLYQEEELPRLPIQYKDFTGWQNREKHKDGMKRQEEYWLKEFNDEIPVLNLPVDFVRPPEKSFAGSTVDFEINPGETKEIKKLAREEDATLFMVLLAIYNIFLSKISGQEDIVIGTPISGRGHSGLQSIIGMFVNTLPLRNTPDGTKSFKEFLKQLSGSTLEAFENQDYQFEDLVEQVAVQRDADRNPVFDTMLALENMETAEIKIPGLNLKTYDYQNVSAKFDLMLTAVEAGENLQFAFEYCTSLFKEETIRRLTGFFHKIISIVIGNREIKIPGIEIINEEEKNRVLYEFNDTEAEYTLDKTIHQLFAEQVDRTPDNIALHGCMIAWMHGEECSITYKELNKKSNRLVHFLKEKGIQPDTIVGIKVERSTEMIIGILGILKSGGAYLPIDPDYPEERIDFMLKDSNVGVLVTTPKLQVKVKAEVEENSRQQGLPLQVIHINTNPGFASEPSISTLTSTSTCQVSPANLAYIIYTSGSTGKPKGVCIEHHSIVNTLVWRKALYRFNQSDAVLQLPSFSFDSSVEDIFSPLISGSQLVLMQSQQRFDLNYLKTFIKKARITHFLIVPALYRTYIEKIPDSLKGMKHITIAGENFTMELVKHHYEKLGHVKLFNEYGPTENSVCSTIYEFGPGKKEVLIGKPIYNVVCYILNRYLKLNPVGIPGELCISGSGLARGYLNRPGLTAGKFKRAVINDQCPMTNDRSHSPHSPYSPIYQTGDLARWIQDGNIEFLGRIDHQVKIRGFRIELGEIENQLLTHRKIKEAIVLFREKNNNKYLCAYMVAKPGETKPIDQSELREYLSHRLPDYMLPSYFVQLAHIPLNPNGKVDRKTLPEPEMKAGKNYIAPRNETEEKLAGIWSEILDVEKEKISMNDNFFHLGGHSLKATVLASRIHKELNINVPLNEIFKTPQIRGLAVFIKNTETKRFFSIEALEKKEYYNLSSAQKRLHFLQQMEPGSKVYNMPTVMTLQGELERRKFEEIFKKSIWRHESLRTSFEMINEETVQRIQENVEFKIQYFDITADTGRPGNIIYDFIRAFDLAVAPLMRVGLIKEENTKQYLMVDIHHIIADGTSIGILQEEIMAIYRGSGLNPLRIHYKEYAEWQTCQKNREALSTQEKFWISQFEEDIPVLNLPTDYARPPVQSFDGDRLYFELNGAETLSLKNLMWRQDVTLYMLLLAICNTWFSKLSGDDDIVIGTPIAGRRHDNLQYIIGMFVNTLALRNYPVPEKTFIDFLKEVKAKTLESFQNQEYQFEDLVERVVTNRDTSRNPVFDVMFVFQNMETPGIEIPGLVLKPCQYENKTAKFDLNLSGMEKQGKLTFELEYSTKLFKEETARIFVSYFKNIINFILENPKARISAVEMMSKEDKERILEISNGMAEPVDVRETIHGMFEKIVKGRGNEDKTALVFKDSRITYRELNKRANRLAYVLRSRGIEPDSPVGLMLERSIELITGILGILKAGGAYLPVDTDYPGQRKKYLLQDSQVALVLTNLEIESITDSNWDKLEFPVMGNEGRYTPGIENPVHLTKGTNLVYLIYTSGTTGEPKGIMMEHRSMVNLITYQFTHTNIPFRRVLQFTTISFDVSFQEILSTLLAGGTLYLVDKETRNEIPVLFEVIKKNDIETLFLPVSFLKFVMNEEEYINLMPTGVQHIVTAGEQLIVNSRLRHCLWENQVWLHNHYGPAETHVVTMLALDPQGEIPELPSIGKPVSNTGIYILNKGRCLQPVGIPGELFIRGIQVSRGYSNRERLTGERYLNNPFVPGERIYKTGDLGKWLPDENIEFLGRIDSQVKIRGFRVELGEIESKLLMHNEIKEAVVLSREDNQGIEQYLCGYFVADLHISTTGLREYLSTVLPEYMIPSYFVQVEKIPITPNGKIDRKALPIPGTQNRKHIEPPRDTLEKKLVEIWSKVLGIEKEKIDINDNFFHLGGHSLKATILASRIRKELHVDVPLPGIFKTPSIRELAAFVKNAERQKFFSILAVEKKEYYKLSSAQQRLFVLQQLDEGGIGYNMPSLWQLEGHLDVEKFESVFQRLVQRHGSLKTSFIVVNDEPAQRINEEVKVKVKVEVKEEEGTLINSFIRPFDLSHAPLLRVDIIKLLHNPSALSSHPRRGTYNSQEGKRDKYLLMVDMHHIISDGVSVGIFVKEFMEMYAGKRPPQLRLQYKDYSEWHIRQLGKESMKEQEAYWLKQFEGEVPVLDLPADYLRPSMQSFAGRILHFEINKEETAALKSLAREKDVTLFMLLLSLYTIFLCKISGQEDIVVGTPIAGRRHANLESIIGMFVNTLALRNFPVEEKTFDQFLGEIKENTIKAFENQDYLYEDLVDQVKVKRNTGRNPLFDTMLALQNMDTPTFKIPGLKIMPYHYESCISKFDLSLYGVEYRKELSFSIEYCTKLFKEETIKRYVGYFKSIVSRLLQDKESRLSEIEIISEEEKSRLLYDFNNIGVDYPRDKTSHRLFEEQEERNPDSMAVIGQSAKSKGQSAEEYHDPWAMRHTITYRELNERSNRLARILRNKGVKPGTLAGIIMPRTIEMMIGILGIMKAGGAYIPIDPVLPEDRINYILAESSVHVILIAGDLKELIGCGFEIVEIGDSHLYRGDSHNLDKLEKSSDLVYVIYTSGSTGRPKGVMIEHRSLVNFIIGITGIIDFNASDSILSLTTISFDIFGLETILPLTKGAKVVIGDREMQLSAEEAVQAMDEEGVTILQVTPSRLFMLVSNEVSTKCLKNLKYLLVGGEIFPEKLLEKTRKLTGNKIYNLYGPTETTIWSTVKDVSAGKTLNIGKPISNTRIYILDKKELVQPLGTFGELCISGDGLARGYLNKPELTAEKFTLAHSSWLTTDRKALKGELNFSMSYKLSAMSYIYKTGDLARWLPDANIEFLGRMDFQVKIRGFRIELGEIEHQLLTHEKIKEAAVIAREDNNDKYLCAYIVAERKAYGAEREEINKLREYLSQYLPDYMVPSYFVQLDNIPLTPNGKIDRKALPGPGIEREKDYVPPRDDIETKLVNIWNDVLTQPHAVIGIDDDFFLMGGHSLKATILISKIHKAFHVNIPLAEIFKTPTIRGLSHIISTSRENTFIDLLPAEEKDFYELSFNQKRLWYIQQMEPGSSAFNMPGRILLEHSVEAEEIKKTLIRLFRRHESFRTGFKIVAGQPVQYILKEVPVPLKKIDVSFMAEKEKQHEQERIFNETAGEPFDLTTAPLFRAVLLKLDTRAYELMFNMHHIITDGWSMEIIKKDFYAVYEEYRTGKPAALEPLPFRYRDFSAWHNRQLQDPLKRNASHQSWKAKLQQGITEFTLPGHIPGTRENKKGAGYSCFVDKDITLGIKQLAERHHTTLFTVMFSVYMILLSRLSGSQEVASSIIGAGRAHASLHRIVGFFVNSIIYNTRVDSKEPFQDFLERVNRELLQLFQHQDYPLETVFKELKMKYPDVPVSFNMLNIVDKTISQGIDSIKSSHIEDMQDVKFDMEIYVDQHKDGMSMLWAYKKSLFDPSAIESFAEEYIKLMDFFKDNIDKSYWDYRHKKKKRSFKRDG